MFPEDAEKYRAELESYYDYEEKCREDEERAIANFLTKCKKSELEDIIWQMLFDGPEWQYDRFIRDFLDL